MLAMRKNPLCLAGRWHEMNKLFAEASRRSKKPGYMEGRQYKYKPDALGVHTAGLSTLPRSGDREDIF